MNKIEEQAYLEKAQTQHEIETAEIEANTIGLVYPADDSVEQQKMKPIKQ